MADDLDAFFDEVSAAEEEAKHDSKDEEHRTTNGGGDQEQASAAGESKEEQEEERPAKRPKVASARGAVVASKTAVVVAAKPAIVAAAQPTVAVSKPSTVNVAVSAVTTIRPTAPAPPPLPPGPPPPPPRQPGVSIGPQIGPSFPPTSGVSAIGPIGPSAVPPPPLPPPPGAPGQKEHASYKRSAAGKSWEDPTLAEFPENDFRLFVGNLAKDIREDQLADTFRSRYPSFAMSRICRNKDDGKSRGYGFVSLMDPKDLARALREMDQTWLGSRPIKVRKSEWKDRDLKEVRKKQRHEKRRNKRHLY